MPFKPDKFPRRSDRPQSAGGGAPMGKPLSRGPHRSSSLTPPTRPAGAGTGGAAGMPNRPIPARPLAARPMGARPIGDRPPQKPFTPRADSRSDSRSSGPSDRTDWNPVAQWYDQLVGEAGSEYQREVVFPGVLRLLTVRPQEKILDVACGQGVFCRILASRGARVTGIDASDELIALAKKRSEAFVATAIKAKEEEKISPRKSVKPPENPIPTGPPVQYQVMDAHNLGLLPSESFAAASCVLAIQDMDQIAQVFAGIAKALAPGGRLVIAMMHPCFRVPKAAGWDWDAKNKVQYRRIDRYLLPRKEAIITHPGKNPTGSTWTFHRPLEAYFRALAPAGLLVDALEEWPSHKTSDTGYRAAAENAARREIPMFMAIRAVKATTAPAAPPAP